MTCRSTGTRANRSARRQGVGLVHGIEPATVIVREMMERAERVPIRFEDVGGS
ncbi:hypothetical protein [Streptomyces chrestomyceticus]|uniref:Uncharacterized protein n=1 Tax=Streptomyces chrestomyceticus TaxID=68185 RepID=A0ABU7WRV6_9ACTN